MIRILYLLSLVFFVSINCFSQNLVDDNFKRNDCSAFLEFSTENLSESEDCDKAKNCASEDMEKGFFILYTSAGMMPRSVKEVKKLVKYQKKYQIRYLNFGCVAPNYNSVKSYNNEVFDYLNLKYGKRWIKKLDKWVYGFAELKQSDKKVK